VALLAAQGSLSLVISRLIEAAEWCVCEQVSIGGDDDVAALRRFDVAVLVVQDAEREGGAESGSAEQERKLGILQRSQVGVLILTSRPSLYAGCGAGVVCLSVDSSVEKVHGVLLALARTRPVLRQIDTQLASLRRLSEMLRRQLEETDRELRLASRLQRDFLPRELPEAGPIRFRSIFRPCTWVSGDIFDIFRLDERHWGFYIADAVGHGVAAGLLTMYIKHAIRPKRMFEDGYEMVPPADVLGLLNDQFAVQELPDSQFITCWYGIINTETLELKYAIAGHPPPMVISADGGLRELHGEGCILGLCKGQEFSNETVLLRPGQRVLLYSDGLEQTLISHRPPMPELPELVPGMQELLRLPGEEVIVRLEERLDTEPGSLTRGDDVTVVVLDVLEEERPSGA
jgi:serine phosphatase RsbU (regulator of sigma subunit)